MKAKQRKFLSISEEEFFERVLLLLGPPTTEFRKYEDQYNMGFLPWMKLSPEGRKFMALVEGHGEAKKRAVRLYIRYHRWFKHEQEKANGR